MKQLVVIDHIGHERLVASRHNGDIYLSIEPPPSCFFTPVADQKPPCESSSLWIPLFVGAFAVLVFLFAFIRGGF